MEIKFELPGLVDEARLNRYLLPVAYVAERVSDNKFNVLTEESRSVVGVCEVEEPFVRVSFFTVKSAGRGFVTAFGVEHPECDPKTLFFGFVYQYSLEIEECGLERSQELRVVRK